MKNILSALFILFILSSATAQDTTAVSEKPSARFVIKTNPLPMLVGQIPFTNEYRLVLEARVSPKSAIQLYGSYMGKGPFVRTLETFTNIGGGNNTNLGVSGYRAQLTWKFYVLRRQEAPEGFYVGPNLSYATAKIWDRYNTADYFNAYYTSITAMAGYQVIAGHFAFDAYVALGVKHNRYNLSDGFAMNSDFTFDKVRWTTVKGMLGFNLGYAF